MKPTVYIYVNGILTLPGASDGWTDRAVTWTHLNTQHRAEKFEYFSGALTRRLWQARRGRKLARMIGFYLKQGWRIHLVGHSNGCDVILRALNELRHDPLPGGRLTLIESLHLFGAACDADFDRNWLNSMLSSGDVQRVRIYVGGRDWALRIAYYTEKVLRWVGLGYGTLGRTGPIGVWCNNSKKVETVVEPQFGHSTWWGQDAIFHRTMEEITA